jgi:hypothetical protein
MLKDTIWNEVYHFLHSLLPPVIHEHLLPHQESLTDVQILISKNQGWFGI